MSKRSKNISKLVEEKGGKQKVFKLEEALEILASTPKTKFVSAVEIDLVLNIKEKNKKDSIRGSIELPNTFGADKKVIVFADEANAKIALTSGAVASGLDDLKKKVLANEIEFDIVIATAESMPKIIELGRILGPKGLMPNPKNGTVSNDIAKAVKEFKGGKLNFKMESGQGVIRNKVGQLDMEQASIVANIVGYVKAVFGETKRLGVNPFKKLVLSSTMGPGVKIDINDIMQRIAV
jgi:large subunit ribosomal protein L1